MAGAVTALQWHERLSALRNLTQELARPLDSDELFRVIHRELARIVRAETFFFALYHEASQTVEVVRQVEAGVELAGGSFPVGSGLTSQVISSRQSQLIRRWSQNGPRVHVQYASQTPGLPESALLVPLVYGEHVLGVLAVYSYEPDSFDENDLLALEVVATQTAMAIANARHSDRLDAQIQRRISELEAILASMADALLIVDAAGRIVHLNHAARQLLSLNDASIILGQPLDREHWGNWPLGAQEVAETLAPMVEALQRGEVIADTEVDLAGPGRRILSFSGTPLRDGFGSLYGSVLIVRDVTGRREVEDLKDEVLSIASHDLRVPVAVIKAQAQLLRRLIDRDAADVGSIDEGLGSIVGQTDHLSRLLTLLLDLSRIEAGRLELARAPMDLRSLVARTIKGMQATTRRHVLELRAPQQVPGNWDEHRLQELLENLLANAVKYSPKGGTISVDMRTAKRGVTVRVSDQGIGLDPDEVPHVFERFYRAKGTRALEGAGLGLYVCQAIVAAHGGRLWAESAGSGHGSTFSFTLPHAAMADA
jgi:two-component system, OmpR family, phosphate regulon sensor histidine kinase PhoR